MLQMLSMKRTMLAQRVARSAAVTFKHFMSTYKTQNIRNVAIIAHVDHGKTVRLIRVIQSIAALQ